MDLGDLEDSSSASSSAIGSENGDDAFKHASELLDRMEAEQDTFKALSSDSFVRKLADHIEKIKAVDANTDKDNAPS
jgi:hypothetical protein